MFACVADCPRPVLIQCLACRYQVGLWLLSQFLEPDPFNTIDALAIDKYVINDTFYLVYLILIGSGVRLKMTADAAIDATPFRI